MINTLKGICVGCIAVCIIFIMISALLFSGEAIDFSSAVRLISIFLLFGLVFFIGYYSFKHIEESNNEWMELGKKKKNIKEYPPTVKRG